MSKSTKLPLTEKERMLLRKAKIKLSTLHQLTIGDLVEATNIDVPRAKELKALAEFQTVPSIGHKLAQKLVYQLEIYSLDELIGQEAPELFLKLEKQLGVWTDGCVEDQLRCVVHYANNRQSTKQWFDFTDERKRYREKFGFPAERPKKAWYDND